MFFTGSKGHHTKAYLSPDENKEIIFSTATAARYSSI